MPEQGEVEFDLRTTELATLGELRKRAREAHLELLNRKEPAAANRFVNVHRVMYHHLSAYCDGDYEDLEQSLENLSRTRFSDPVAEQRIDDMERMSSLVDDVISDTGFAIERETEFDPENHAVQGLR
jgi:hypothetical protein